MTRFDKPRFRAVFGAALLLVAAGLAGDAARAVCVGDCNDDGKVIISEVQRCVNIKNNPATIDTCRNADQNNDGTVTQSEVDNCIASFLDAASCTQVEATPTPQNTSTPSQTSTITVTNTIAPTLTPTNTPVGPSLTPIPTHTPTNTLVPTAIPTNTATQTSTPTPTLTATVTQPPTLTPTGPTIAICGDGVTTAPEQCDDGGNCVGGPTFCQAGPNMGTACTTETAAVVCGVVEASGLANPCYGNHCTSNTECGAGACTPFGGDGCASNCTHEDRRPFVFTGAVCSGGVLKSVTNNVFDGVSFTLMDGKVCTSIGSTGGNTPATQGECGVNGTCFGAGECTSPASRAGQSCTGSTTNPSQTYCLAGPAKGRLCASSTSIASCRVCDGPNPAAANYGKACTATADCGTGLTCPSFQCNAGAKAGQACTTDAFCVAPNKCNQILVCNSPDPLKNGVACKLDSECGTGGVCGSICSSQCGASTAAPSCLSKSRARLEGGVLQLNIGPLQGSQVVTSGQANPVDGRIPVVIKASDVQFKPIKVPSLACACVRGIPAPDIHGPGNSASGQVGCGIAGLMGVDITLAVDHNTTPSHKCIQGPKIGEACDIDTQCSAFGTCNLATSKCDGGPNPGGACVEDNDCVGIGVCSRQGPGVCSANTTGGKAGNLCTIDPVTGVFDCPGGTCVGYLQGGGICVGGTDNRKRCPSTVPLGVDCAAPGVCTSPDDPNCTAADALPERRGRKACLESKSICTAGTIAQGTACAGDADCGVNGVCGNGCNATSIHPGVCNSPIHIIASGTGGQGAAVLLNTSAIGTIVDGGGCNTDTSSIGQGQGKGLDGIPCTDDDPPFARGSAQTLPTTTGTAAGVLVDANPDGILAGTVFINGPCTGNSLGTTCIDAIKGSEFSCTALMNDPTGGTSGGRIATAFPVLETAKVGDNVVTSLFSAR